MDRLTKHVTQFICNNSNCIIAKCENCENRLPQCYGEDCGASAAIVDRLADYEDTGLTLAEVMELAQAKADGRLVVLPCKVGDTVYEISGGEIYEMDVISFEIDDCVCVYLSEDITYGSQSYDFDDFGKTVFLTRPEAQAALDRLEGRE